MIRQKADIGIAWDGDADRCFFIDGSGEFISGDFITALLAEAFLLKMPKARRSSTTCAPATPSRTSSRATAARALMNRVGHAFIKRRMREEDGIFAGEVTGHYYFRDFYYADNGFIPALLILELMSKKDKTLRELLAPLPRALLHLRRDQHQAREHGRSAREARSDRGEVSRRADRAHRRRVGGLSDWHFNVRASNTEPLLRLNLEAETPALMEQKRDEVLALIRG